ncbi:hypothetical protein [Sphingobium estronivorans]|uniref:hypothetical protein n=1 Tax=Sphingobium estronivorans TaxID=1577690 RepID=UPI00123874BA|nr:hypothetical protein [Sphingobium estronivorans]
MTSSLTIIAAYAGLLLLVLLAPYASVLAMRHAGGQRSGDRAICAILLIGAVALTIARHGAFPMIGIFVLIPLIGLGVPSLLGGITAALLFATAFWWTPSPQLGFVPTLIAALLALAAGYLPRWKEAAARHVPLMPCLILCALVGLAVGLFTAPFEASETTYAAWHHWGAYLAPVEAWRGGGVPYRDFPIQYGLGPTLLLMEGCGDDCWRGMYATAITANALYFATLGGGVILLTARLSRGVRWLALLAMFCAAFFWTGFPTEFAGPAMTPSVAGLRFLSISALLLHILHAEQRQVRRDWIGHAIWLIDLFWSPEAAFFGSLIWWPYLALRDAEGASGKAEAARALAKGALRGAGALAVGMAGLALALWLLSARSIALWQFLAYIQHPPGALPVNPAGTVWIALAAIALALPILGRRGLSAAVRPLYACLLGLAGAGSYFISRSHDNNILNLFPLLVPLLCAILVNMRENRSPTAHFVRCFIYTGLTTMIAFVTAFNFAHWQQGSARSGLLTLGPAKLISRFTPDDNNRPPFLSADAVAGLDYLRARHAGMVMLFDDNKLMPRSPAGLAWTGVNNIANFAPLPDAMIQYYIERGAVAYRRPGWILVDRDHAAWAAAFQRCYDVRDRKSFGRYQALYLTPRGSR